ncbi:DUF4326 domain-containing protein [Nesterenkonia flava]|uniref:DUF4326 domain-containing protein n=1 Tax=Nesterenkonia flava TaxID=469799 RepID=A0ABU1FXN6_9MICC|nr:DUF4326 domain-containing protein [Nesterenkonia flava]MDR5712946.1 DUF4326 domain-containing protein [Nesterenkonia flava]
MPERIQRSRAKGWRLPVGATIVDRSSRWGNPFIIRPRLATRPDDKHGAGETIPGRWVYDVINTDTGEQRRTGDTRAYAHQFATQKYEEETLYYRLEHGQIDLEPLRGRDLACWCPTADPETGRTLACHADVLLEYAAHPDPLQLARDRKAGRNPKQYHH